MSGSDVYNIPLPDQDSAPDAKPYLSPGMLARQKDRLQSQHSSSTPTLSSSSGHFSGSTVTDPVVIESAGNLRSRRPEGSTSSVDRTSGSAASNPDGDSDSTYTEQTPLMEEEGGSVDISVSEEEDAQSIKGGTKNLIIVMGLISAGLLCFGGYLVWDSLWNTKIPEIPEGFISNTTAVFNADIDMD